MSTGNTSVTCREVEASRIPSGERITIPADTEIVITQALGSSFTVLVPSQAGLFRIEGPDADAIGRERPAALDIAPEASMEDSVWAQLKTCYDPEIPVNSVDLGLVYSLEIMGDNAARSVRVQMTLTAPGCGMGPTIASEARQKILTLDGVSDASVDIVWEPAWTPERMTPEGRKKLGMAD
jgi:probable FeS assembly SUF system protein SufT